jgi:hypothetical protein
MIDFLQRRYTFVSIVDNAVLGHEPFFIYWKKERGLKTCIPTNDASHNYPSDDALYKESWK